MNWNFTMGLISSVCLFLPIALIILLRLGAYRTFPYLLAYYSIAFICNVLNEGYINSGSHLKYYLGIFNNIMDAPLMIAFLMYFSTSVIFTRRMKLLIILFLVFDAVVILWGGFNISAITIILAPGLAAIISFCVLFFVRQSKLAILHQKATGKALIVSSLLFAYGCYIIIYLIFYVFKTKDVANTFIIFFIVTTFSSLLMCAGIIMEKKRIRKLVELKVVRKELSSLYNEPKNSIPIQQASLKDKERFN